GLCVPHYFCTSNSLRRRRLLGVRRSGGNLLQLFDSVSQRSSEALHVFRRSTACGQTGADLLIRHPPKILQQPLHILDADGCHLFLILAHKAPTQGSIPAAVDEMRRLFRESLAIPLGPCNSIAPFTKRGAPVVVHIKVAMHAGAVVFEYR